MSNCLTNEQAQDLVWGRCRPQDIRDAEDHMAGCRDCRRWVSELARDRSSLASEHGGYAGTAELEDALELGDVLGRYRLCAYLGQGGMGRVFAGLDLLLRRRVAVKVLHGHSTPDRAKRLQAEARSLARCSDPHVVQVFDVGTWKGCVYIVMELLDGVPLRQWMHSQHDWSQIARVFAQAGRGLAAAHRVHLLHRDFKPSNAIVASDGTVRVIDFGLARRDSPESSRADREAIANERLHEGTSMSCEVVGTPGYLAPELRSGNRATAASDQYSFCVALHEALSSPDHHQMRSAPRWLRALVERGLQEDPSQRWPSMQELVAALERQPSRLGRRALTFSMICAGGLAATANVRPQSCLEQAQARLEQVWNPARARQVERAVAATGVPWASQARARVSSRLEEQAERLLSTHAMACEGSSVTQTRALCWEQGLQRLEATVAVLTGVDAESMVHIENLLDFANSDGCTAPEEELSGQIAEEIRELGAALTRMDALRHAGKLERVASFAEELEPRVLATGDRMLFARLALLRGAVQAGELDTHAVGLLEEALFIAQSADNADLAARAAVELADALGPREGVANARADDALRTARAWSLRSDGATRWGFRIAGVEARMNEIRGDYESALAISRRMLVLAQEAYGSESVQVASALVSHANYLDHLGSSEEALIHQDRAIALYAKLVGPEHPWSADAYYNKGYILMALGRPDEAAAWFEKTLHIREHDLGPEHFSVGVALGHYGGALVLAGQPREAIAHLQRAVEIEGRRDVPLTMATVLNDLGNAYVLTGRYDEAASAYARGTALLEEAFPSHPTLALLLSGLASAQMESAPEQAVTHARRALDMVLQARHAGDPKVAFNYLVLGQALSLAGRLEEAEAVLREGLDSARSSSLPQRFIPDLEFALAQVVAAR